MDDLIGRLEALEHHVRTLEQQGSSALQRLRWWRRLACTLALLTMFSLPLTLGAAQDDRRAGKPKDDHQATLKGLLQRFLAIERKLEHVTSVVGPEGFPELVITGANLRIVNGLGSTDCLKGDNPIAGEPIPDCPNGLGNLIVGYNEPSQQGENVRTGSHNVVVGQAHSFSRFGGLVVGLLNTISGDFAVVSGGLLNIAAGTWSAVSGGQHNTTEGSRSTVSGGGGNTASGIESVVSGGVGNGAGGVWSVVSGGTGNSASGDASAVSGGSFNTAAGGRSAISGGADNRAVGTFSVVSGGEFNQATGGFSVVSAGDSNTAAGTFAAVSGGQGRQAPGALDWVAGGLFQEQ